MSQVVEAGFWTATKRINLARPIGCDQLNHPFFLPHLPPSDPHLNYNKPLFGPPPRAKTCWGGKFKLLEIGKYIWLPLFDFPLFPDNTLHWEARTVVQGKATPQRSDAMFWPPPTNLMPDYEPPRNAQNQSVGPFLGPNDHFLYHSHTFLFPTYLRIQ